jgi:hypothetical protein
MSILVTDVIPMAVLISPGPFALAKPLPVAQKKMTIENAEFAELFYIAALFAVLRRLASL